MTNKSFAIAYCKDNKYLVEQIDQRLSRAQIKFRHLTCKSEAGDFAEELGNSVDPVLLFVSDNFLKSEDCMHNGLKALLQLVKSNKVYPIVINGIKSNDENENSEMVPTSFDSVSHVIQYMNFWQDKYLTLRKQKNSSDRKTEDVFNAKLKKVRSISTEIGEFLRHLRTLDYWTFEAFTNNHFEVFFNKLANPEMHLSYIKTAGEDTPLLQELTNIDPVNNITKKKAKKSSVLKKVLKYKKGNSEGNESDNKKFANPTIDEIVEEIVEEEKQLGINEIHDKSLDSKYAILDSIFEDDEENNEEMIKNGNGGQEIVSKNIKLGKKPVEETKKSIEDYLDLAIIAESKNDFLLAKSNYEKVVQLDQKTPGIYYKLGSITANYFDDKQDIAAGYFKKAIKADKKNADAHYQYALLLLDFYKSPRKAINHFQETLRLQPKHAFANYDLALIYHAESQLGKAKKFYKKAYQTNPELKTEENDRAFYFEKEKKKKTAKAKKVVEKNEVNDSGGAKINAVNQVTAPHDQLKNQELVEELVVDLSEIKTVLITGATSGIGRATADLFAKNGYRLILTGRRKDRLEKIKSGYENAYNSSVLTLNFDVRDMQSSKKAIENIPEEFENIDLLINNAGLAMGKSPIHEGDINDWDTMIDTNIKGLLYMSRLVSPGMVKRKSGHIINVCSSAGHEVYLDGNVYCATKFAVDALSKSMRLDLVKHKVRVSQVSPGHVEETEFAKVRFHGDEEKAKIYEDFQPLKSKDVAEAIYFIATRPAHVNLHDIIMMGTQQASINHLERSGRD